MTFGTTLVNELISQWIKVERNILHKIKLREANWIGNVCLLKHAIEGKIDGTGRRGRRRKQLLDDLEEKIRHRNLRQETLDGNVWKKFALERLWACRKAGDWFAYYQGSSRFKSWSSCFSFTPCRPVPGPPPTVFINLLKPTGHGMHQQFNIQQLYVLPTLYLCVLYLSENKQRLVPLAP